MAFTDRIQKYSAGVNPAVEAQAQQQDPNIAGDIPTIQQSQPFIESSPGTAIVNPDHVDDEVHGERFKRALMSTPEGKKLGVDAIDTLQQLLEQVDAGGMSKEQAAKIWKLTVQKLAEEGHYKPKKTEEANDLGVSKIMEEE